MTLEEILTALGSGLGVLFILALGFIKIPKKELNIWGLIGKEMTKDVDKKIDEINKRLDSGTMACHKVNERLDETDSKIDEKFKRLDDKLERHIQDSIEDQMKVRRRAILQFDDDLAEGRLKSKEHYINILDTIDHYENYCADHPKFPNNMCVMAIEHIKREYQEHLDKNDFKQQKQRS